MLLMAVTLTNREYRVSIDVVVWQVVGPNGRTAKAVARLKKQKSYTLPSDLALFGNTCTYMEIGEDRVPARAVVLQYAYVNRKESGPVRHLTFRKGKPLRVKRDVRLRNRMIPMRHKHILESRTPPLLIYFDYYESKIQEWKPSLPAIEEGWEVLLERMEEPDEVQWEGCLPLGFSDILKDTILELIGEDKKLPRWKRLLDLPGGDSCDEPPLDGVLRHVCDSVWGALYRELVQEAKDVMRSAVAKLEAGRSEDLNQKELGWLHGTPPPPASVVQSNKKDRKRGKRGKKNKKEENNKRESVYDEFLQGREGDTAYQFLHSHFLPLKEEHGIQVKQCVYVRCHSFFQRRSRQRDSYWQQQLHCPGCASKKSSHKNYWKDPEKRRKESREEMRDTRRVLKKSRV